MIFLRTIATQFSFISSLSTCVDQEFYKAEHKSMRMILYYLWFTQIRDFKQVDELFFNTGKRKERVGSLTFCVDSMLVSDLPGCWYMTCFLSFLVPDCIIYICPPGVGNTCKYYCEKLFYEVLLTWILKII